MRERFFNWLNSAATLKYTALILAFCLLFTASFSFGAVMGSRSVWLNAPNAPPLVTTPQ